GVAAAAAKFLVCFVACCRRGAPPPPVHPLQSGEYERTAHRGHKRTQRDRHRVGLPLAEVGQQELLARLEKEQAEKREQGYLQPGRATKPVREQFGHGESPDSRS